MSTDHLPDHVDFRRLAARQTQLEGVVPLSALDRVCAQLTDAAGAVAVSLRFFQDDEHRSLVEGTVRGSLHMLCQRCLQSMPWAVEADFRLVAVASDAQARQLPDDCEPWVVGDEPVVLTELIEEELLLALPIVSFHEDCQPVGPMAVGVVEAEPVRENPFLALEVLKTGPKGQ